MNHPHTEAEQRAADRAVMEATELDGPANEFVLSNVFGLKPRVMGELVKPLSGPVPSDWAVL